MTVAACGGIYESIPVGGIPNSSDQDTSPGKYHPNDTIILNN